MKENSIEEDMKILEGIIKGDEDCINAIYSQMKVKNDNDEDIQYYKKEIQSIKNIVDNYLKEKARADKLEKEYSAMLTESDENECDYKRVLKENEELKKSKITYETVRDIQEKNKNIVDKNYISKQIIKDKIEEVQKEYNKLDKQVDEYINDANKDLSKYYENKEKIGTMQTLAWVIDNLQELLEGRK